MSTKLIVVFGATGAQGGSVVKSLLTDPSFSIRAVTRNPESEKAVALKEKGVEVVKGDLTSDTAALFKGAYGVFLLTNFWDPSQMGKEFEVAKPVVAAAKTAGVKHVIFSSLANVDKESKGKWDVPHFTHKALVADLIQETGFQYATNFAPAFYYQNLSTFFPIKEVDGEFVFTLPATKQVDMFDVDQSGEYVLGALQQPEIFNKRTIYTSGYHGDLQTIADTYAKVKGVKTKLVQVPLETFAGLFPGAAELAQMFGWFDEFGYHGVSKDLQWQAKAIGEGKATSYSDFLKK
eukprot:TRINITY_DN476_c0_g2_i1.p1 TRINITY_DN476_c0_g2~~TRINITY_DN476_c0_g2_i1.p1  ORF type:complete len:319 (+),score=92.45 TRINITY_DN476_c0_g2_i1:83-958(+)